MKQQCMNDNVKGFTLIELMITVAIIAILASVGLPSYQSYVDDSRRKEGATALLNVAAAQERFYTANSRYASQIADLPVSSTSETGSYTLATDNVANNTSTFTATATPTGWADALCEVLSIDNIGNRGESGSGSVSDCWE